MYVYKRTETYFYEQPKKNRNIYKGKIGVVLKDIQTTPTS